MCKATQVSLTFGNDANSPCNGLGCDWVITSDHDDFDSSTAAFADGVRDSGSRRVNHGHQADKAEILEGEVCWLQKRRNTTLGMPATVRLIVFSVRFPWVRVTVISPGWVGLVLMIHELFMDDMHKTLRHPCTNRDYFIESAWIQLFTTCEVS